jgi:hypothetical protein
MAPLRRSQNEQPELYCALKVLAIPAGLEPATLCLEGRCSIQLSYGIMVRRGTDANVADNGTRDEHRGKPIIATVPKRKFSELAYFPYRAYRLLIVPPPACKKAKK